MKHWMLTILWRARNERGFLARTLARFCVAALAAGAFVAFAWRADPGPTRAEQAQRAEPSGADQQSEASESPEVEAGHLGSLVGRDAVLRIYATNRGPRYWLWGSEGQLLGANLFEEQVRYLAPGVSPSDMLAHPPRLMDTLADTPEID